MTSAYKVSRVFTAFRADLHLHTCLSPCAEKEMTPLAIVRQAKKLGLNVVGICDHNSTRNVAAVRQAGQREGIAVIGGMEVTSKEEVHILGLFDEEENLQQMQQLVDRNLHGENNPELFGQQELCSQYDTIIGQETKLLIGATGLSVEEVVESIHHLDGLAIASHIDRESFSLLSQLGFVPEGLQIDALEVSPLCSESRFSCFETRNETRQRQTSLEAARLVSFSDAHRLEEVGKTFTTFTGTSPCVSEFNKALLREDGREVVNF